MKSYYKMLNYELNSLMRGLVSLYIGAILSPLILLYIATKNFVPTGEPFESYYRSSGCVALFVIFFALLCGFCIKNLYANYWGSKSIYTLLTLPINREIIYWSKLSAFFLGFLGLVAAQLLSVFLSYSLFKPKIPVLHSDGMGHYENLLKNGLFLAFIRSDFLRLLLPLGMENFLSSLSILITIVCSLVYGVLCERSNRYWGFALILGGMGIIIFTIARRMDMGVYLRGDASPYGTWLSSFLLLALAGFFINLPRTLVNLFVR